MIRMAVPLWFHIARTLLRAVVDGLVIAGCVVVAILAALALT